VAVLANLALLHTVRRVNENHATLCSSDDWASYIKDSIIGPISTRADLGRRMLEIGPGPGAATEQLRHLVEQLTVIEVDGAAASELERRYRLENVEVLCHDATAVPFDDETFDSVGAFTMLHHVPTVRMQDQILAEAWRVLRPGGVFVGSDSLASTELHEFHRDDTYNPVEPASLFTRLKTAGFTSVALEVDAALLFMARKSETSVEAT
jgi:ubiquinone/menaquinone biosynthesis C-methylase UbiE